MTARELFQKAVLSRDDYDCVHCSRRAVGAHRLLAGRVWVDEGYHEANGVALCAECRVGALRGDITPKQLREDAGLEVVLLPDRLEDDFEYDMWGNTVGRITKRHPRHFDPT